MTALEINMKWGHKLDPLCFSKNRCLFKYLTSLLFRVPESFWSLLWATAPSLVGKDGRYFQSTLKVQRLCRPQGMWNKAHVPTGRKQKTKITGLFFSNWPGHPEKSHRRNLAQLSEVSTLLQVWRTESYNERNKVILRNKSKCLICRNFLILT